MSDEKDPPKSYPEFKIVSATYTSPFQSFRVGLLGAVGRTYEEGRVNQLLMIEQRILRLEAVLRTQIPIDDVPLPDPRNYIHG